METPHTQPRPKVAQEERIGYMPFEQRRASHMQISLERVHCQISQQYQSLLRSLPDDLDGAPSPINLIDAQSKELAHAQTGSIEHLEHAAVTQPQGRAGVRRLDQPLDLLHAQHLRQRL